MTRVPTECDSPAFKKMENKVKEKMIALFKTDNPANVKYSDFKNYFEAPDQGDDFCDYKTVLNDYKPQPIGKVSHSKHLEEAGEKKEEE